MRVSNVDVSNNQQEIGPPAHNDGPPAHENVPSIASITPADKLLMQTKLAEEKAAANLEICRKLALIRELKEHWKHLVTVEASVQIKISKKAVQVKAAKDQEK